MERSLNKKLETLDDALRCNGLNLKRFAEELDNTEVDIEKNYNIWDATRQFWWSDDKKVDLINFINAQ